MRIQKSNMRNVKFSITRIIKFFNIIHPFCSFYLWNRNGIQHENSIPLALQNSSTFWFPLRIVWSIKKKDGLLSEKHKNRLSSSVCAYCSLFFVLSYIHVKFANSIPLKNIRLSLLSSCEKINCLGWEYVWDVTVSRN